MKYKILAITPPNIVEGKEVLMPFYVTKLFDTEIEAKQFADTLLVSNVICAYRVCYSINQKHESDWLMSDTVVYTPKEYAHLPMFV